MRITVATEYEICMQILNCIEADPNQESFDLGEKINDLDNTNEIAS